MSLARSLTSRMRARFEESNTPSLPSRAFSTKVHIGQPRPMNQQQQPQQDKKMDRRLISLPVELLSTSNSQAYEAPDIKSLIESKPIMSPGSPGLRSPNHSPSQPLSPLVHAHQQSPLLSASSSASSTRSWDRDYDGMASPALTSASSVTSHEFSREPSPSNCDPHAMSSFFLDKDPLSPATPLHHDTTLPKIEESPAPHALSAAETSEPPAIPERSSTHTKQTHQVLARQRSMRSMRSMNSLGSRASSERQVRDDAEPEPAPLAPSPVLSPAKSMSSLSSAAKRASPHSQEAVPKLPLLQHQAQRTSTDAFFSQKDSLLHPFGAELAKVSELAEEFARDDVTVVDEETQYLVDHGFGRFAASEYMLEIQPLFFRAFGEPALPVISEWI